MVKCLVLIHILFNIVLLVLSCSCIGFGIWLLLQEDWSIIVFGLYSVHCLGWVAIASGILIFFTTILGLCGALQHNRICILLHVTVIGVCCILVIVAASLLFTYQNKVHNFLDEQVKNEFFNKYSIDGIYTSTWDEIQATTKCCGVINGGDYKLTKWYNNTDNGVTRRVIVPSTCCTHYDNGTYINESMCINPQSNGNNIYVFSEGCLSKIKGKIITVTFVTSIVLFVFCGILIFGLFFGCITLRLVTREVRYGQVV